MSTGYGFADLSDPSLARLIATYRDELAKSWLHPMMRRKNERWLRQAEAEQVRRTAAAQ